MRTIPIGVICLGENKSEIETFEAAIKMGAVTHVDPRCGLSVAIVSALVMAMCKDEIRNERDLDGLLERAWAYVSKKYEFVAEDDKENPEGGMDRKDFERYVYAKELGDMELHDAQKMGYTYKCLGSGIWCLRQVLTRRETFKSAMVKLIMCGGDADTNGAVAGGLMGALTGWEYLPKEWRDGMKHKEWYNKKIDQLSVVLGWMDGIYQRLEDKDTEEYGGRGILSAEEIRKREMEVMEKILLAEKKRAEDAEAERKASRKSAWFNW